MSIYYFYIIALLSKLLLGIGLITIVITICFKKQWLKNRRFHIFLFFLFFVLLLYPKDSGYIDNYGPDRICSCLGKEYSGGGLEGGKLTTCIGIAYACKKGDFGGVPLFIVTPTPTH